ncbi:MAG: hypothetical protein PHD05_05015 [Sphaerochaetaceae bacterium]|nr:hypothetical protein [Sphaerochaetaceae bacterium]
MLNKNNLFVSCAGKYLMEGQYILDHGNINSKDPTQEEFNSIINGFDSIIKFSIIRKYEIIHIAHAIEFFIKGILTIKGIGFQKSNNHVAMLGELIKILKNMPADKFFELFPKVTDKTKFFKDLNELNKFRRTYIHSINEMIYPGSKSIQRYLSVAEIIAQQLEKNLSLDKS